MYRGAWPLHRNEACPSSRYYFMIRFFSSPLFDGDLPDHFNKSKLIGDIKSRLVIPKWSRESFLPTHVIVDFMSKMRQIPLAQFSTLGGAIMLSSTQRQEYVRGQSTFILH
ncbi:hypothetical protein DPMN_190224 [Dreissena polymorpha]|uniref:Uncharacterized protein n=1 Tax=Dreissena polymorpha TaxID=45954 RepID=A0A9D4ID46_DREPO|nr:hypothetical protein DPMN_190224 [Dreissena polymorpha]